MWCVETMSRADLEGLERAESLDAINPCFGSLYLPSLFPGAP